MKQVHLYKLLISGVLAATGFVAVAPIAMANSEAAAVTAAPIRPNRVLLLDIARAGKRLVAVGERGVILGSDDDGKTWMATRAPVTRTLTALTFIDDKVGVAVGHGGSVLRTQDAGKTWTQIKIPETGIDSVLGITHLGGQEIIAYGAFGMYLKSEDSGLTWTRPHILSKVESFDRHIYKIVKAGDVLVLAAENGNLARSTDHGVTFEPVVSDYPGSYFGAVVANDGAVIIFGMRGTVYRSTDGGSHWTKVPLETKIGFNNGVVLEDGTLMLAGNSGVLAVSHDNGVSFKQIGRAHV